MGERWWIDRNLVCVSGICISHPLLGEVHTGHNDMSQAQADMASCRSIYIVSSSFIDQCRLIEIEKSPGTVRGHRFRINSYFQPKGTLLLVRYQNFLAWFPCGQKTTLRSRWKWSALNLRFLQIWTSLIQLQLLQNLCIARYTLGNNGYFLHRKGREGFANLSHVWLSIE